MSGIIGSYKYKVDDLAKKTSILSHRGTRGRRVLEKGNFQVAFIPNEPKSINCKHGKIAVCDGEIYPISQDESPASMISQLIWSSPRRLGDLNGMFAFAASDGERLFMARDQLGTKPLFYIQYGEGIVFASEAKSLADFDGEIKRFPAGHYFDSEKGFARFYELPSKKTNVDEQTVAPRLYDHLDLAIKLRMHPGIGAWLSGGLDSSAICALASQYTNRLSTFFVGTEGASDRPYAQIVADYLSTDHHERILTPTEIVESLPKVIFRLESFDACLVRSSVLNHFAAKLASDHVSVILSGEGSDELFGGYDYLSDVQDLDNELVNITNALQDTSLQRVDRMSSAHSITARVPFTDHNVVEYAFSLPADIKVFNGTDQGKWILRKAMEGKLPKEIIQRKKIKFWQGGGVTEILGRYADGVVPDLEFNKANSKQGIHFGNKEDYLYYKILSEQMSNLSFLNSAGRTEHP